MDAIEQAAPAPQHEEASMPVAVEEKPEPKKPAENPADDWPESPSGLGFGIVGGLGLGFLETDLGGTFGKQKTTAGGLFVHASGSGFSEGFSLSARLTALLGGGGGGQETMFTAHVFIGGGATLGTHSQLYARIGLEGRSFKNDEVEASSTSIIAGQLGYQLWLDSFGFDLAPRIGMSPRTEYEPGDESAGRRHWRRVSTRAAVGGSAMIIVSDVAFVDASFTRVVDDDPVDVLDGTACLVPFHFALCGVAQYWKSIATVPFGPATSDVPTTYFGFAIGIGAAASGPERILGGRRPPRPPPPPVPPPPVR